MFILWYSASSTFGKDSDIVMGVRAQQKEKTRRSLVEAAFSQLSAERSFASLSLREVAREALLRRVTLPNPSRVWCWLMGNAWCT